MIDLTFLGWRLIIFTVHPKSQYRALYGWLVAALTVRLGLRRVSVAWNKTCYLTAAAQLFFVNRRFLCSLNILKVCIFLCYEILKQFVIKSLYQQILFLNWHNTWVRYNMSSDVQRKSNLAWWGALMRCSYAVCRCFGCHGAHCSAHH